MTTQVMNSQYDLLKEEDISYNAWNQFTQLKDSQTKVKPTYRVVHNEVEEEYDEETLVGSAWCKFCEIKEHVQKKPEYKIVSKEEEIQEEIDGAWKAFIEDKEKNATKKTEYIKVSEEKDDTEEETVIDGAWKEFIDIKSVPTKKTEYIKITEDDFDNEEETNQEEFEGSAWNNFKTIESEEKSIKKQQNAYESPKKAQRVKIHLADCAWNEFVTSDRGLFEKYEKYLERVEDDIIVLDETFAEEESADSGASIINEGETIVISDSFMKEIENKNEVEEVKPSKEVKVDEEVKEEVKPTEEVKAVEEAKEEVKPTEEVKVAEEAKEEVKVAKETKEEVKSDEKPLKKKGKLSKFMKKTKKILKKIFSHKKKENKSKN
ncbi:hypothetical protein BCR36DRAFT_366487 [Piromyces finnis]|uniref:Uncharacterized protein n=1 Tax=Piromyces finnis TaxID=1754191 RepID=A0A1Y1VMD5_9FUNG|nr:hypothetical protein BCR36DRAFT_366487 [Piromyces finnis]|eukprot:ORX59306.1 hypothetical protein BCR36DRAFT_366487 [Piromyces finnis]